MFTWKCTILKRQVASGQANIEQIVKAVKFKDDLVAGEELLNAFHLVDLLGPA